MQMTLQSIDDVLAPAGLLVLGGFNPRPDDGVPDGGDGFSLVLVGNAGPDMWRVFSNSNFDKNDANPLDNWTRRVLNGVAGKLSDQFGISATALFPFDGPPYFPFQRWAARSGKVHPTPIGPMIHATYGMWHAYRGALVVASKLDLALPDTAPNPCQSCSEKPCLTTCPVDAFSARGYDVPACLELIEKDADGECYSTGCMARKACPMGREYIYEKAQARFHMEKFLDAHRP